MAENAGNRELRTHAVASVKRPTERLKRVSLPLVRSKQPGTVALDNAKIFEIIPFP
jgi:hypothetical protein